MPPFIPISPVPVTAYTALGGHGTGNIAFYQALLANTSALSRLTLLDIAFSTPVAEIKATLPAVPPELQDYDSRNSRVALAALNFLEDEVRDALEEAKARYGLHRIGVVIGTSTSGLYETESAYATLMQTGQMPADFHFLTRHAYQATPRFLQLELGLQGPCLAISTACSSAAKAIAAGQRLIVSGVCDAVLTGGVDTLCRLTLRGFHSLELVSATQCRPMDKERRGINIGEGAGLLLLEKRRPETRDFPHVLAVGESSDAYHMSSPHPEGRGAASAMNNALQLAGLKASAIDYLNLHATGTRLNDLAEAKAVYELFGNQLPCSGTKGITGHTLGAAGAIEAVVALLALKYRFMPGTCGLRDTDSECRCRVLKETRLEQNLQMVMSNSFGFGGNNASIIFSDGYE